MQLGCDWKAYACGPGPCLDQNRFLAFGGVKGQPNSFPLPFNASRGGTLVEIGIRISLSKPGVKSSRCIAGTRKTIIHPHRRGTHKVAHRVVVNREADQEFLGTIVEGKGDEKERYPVAHVRTLATPFSDKNFTNALSKVC